MGGWAVGALEAQESRLGREGISSNLVLVYVEGGDVNVLHDFGVGMPSLLSRICANWRWGSWIFGCLCSYWRLSALWVACVFARWSFVLVFRSGWWVFTDSGMSSWCFKQERSDSRKREFLEFVTCLELCPSTFLGSMWMEGGGCECAAWFLGRNSLLLGEAEGGALL